MKILVTGAKGFVGKNLVASLLNIKNGKDKPSPAISVQDVYEYDIDSTPEQLEAYCKVIKNLEAELSNNPNYQYEDSVAIYTINYNKRKYEEVGAGTVSINKDNIILKGIINGEEILHSFHTSTYPTLPFIPGQYLEIQDGQDIYRLKFSDPYNVTIFVNILKIINQSYNLIKK